MASDNSQIIHTPDLTGAGVRTLAVTTLVDGSPVTVHMQVVSIADSEGRVMHDFASYEMQRQMLEELRLIRNLLAEQSDTFIPGPD